MMNNGYDGPERRNLATCPLTAEQAYKMQSLLEESVLTNECIMRRLADIEKENERRFKKLEQYVFVGRVIIWFVGSCAAITAGLIHFWNDLRNIFISSK